jgi:hypothetical protein
MAKRERVRRIRKASLGWRPDGSRRGVAAAVVVVVAALAGGCGAAPSPAPAAGPGTAPPGTVPPGTRAADAAERAGRAPRPVADEAVRGPAAVLVRSVGDLPGAVAGRVRAVRGVAAVAVVRSGSAYLTGSWDRHGRLVDAPRPGWGLPVDVAGIDPAAYAALLPAWRRAAVARLRPGEVLLGATAARLRRLGPRSTLALGGRRLRVAGIVDDDLVGGAEVVAGAADAAGIGVAGASFVLATTGHEAAVDAAGLRRRVGAALAGVAGVLVRDLGPAPWPVSWREVLPQALVKDRFGEFPVRLAAGRGLDVAPGWARANIVTASVPLLGRVRCHRAMVPALRAALGELERRGLAGLVDPGDFAGCYNPRLIARGAPVSRHAWGIAVDLNASRNPNGAPSRQDPRLVEVMERHGFAFGGRWPVPDAMHFEYRGA